jgi:hypothetical protein
MGDKEHERHFPYYLGRFGFMEKVDGECCQVTKRIKGE